MLLFTQSFDKIYFLAEVLNQSPLFRTATCIFFVFLIFGGKKPLGRPRHRQRHNKIDLIELGWEDVEWIHVAHDRDEW
jgi:hypothetical protein